MFKQTCQKKKKCSKNKDEYFIPFHFFKKKLIPFNYNPSQSEAL